MGRRLESYKPSHPKWCQRCRLRRANIGVGLEPVEWLCVECFDLECAAIAADVRAGLEALVEGPST